MSGGPIRNVYAAALTADARWTEEVAAGDGSHPGLRGYTALAELVAPAWRRRVRAEPAGPDAGQLHRPGPTR